MKIDCVSDLHGFYPDLEGGDLLIVSGDLTARDTPNEYAAFVIWLQCQKYAKKIVIGGNHDNFLQENKGWADLTSLGFTYLCDSGTEFEGLRIWGSPWTKKFTSQNPECAAFSLGLDVQMMEKWELIPPDTHILITHTPPFATLDRSHKYSHRFGCVKLADKLLNMNNLKLHVFGHIHGGYGMHRQVHHWNEDVMGHFSVNAAIMDESYNPTNKPIRIEL